VIGTYHSNHASKWMPSFHCHQPTSNINERRASEPEIQIGDSIKVVHLHHSFVLWSTYMPCGGSGDHRWWLERNKKAPNLQFQDGLSRLGGGRRATMGLSSKPLHFGQKLLPNQNERHTIWVHPCGDDDLQHGVQWYKLRGGSAGRGKRSVSVSRLNAVIFNQSTPAIGSIKLGEGVVLI
jgi:hypothetical protein